MHAYTHYTVIHLIWYPEDEIIDASSGKWLRFNDNLVDEFTMSETSLEAECFGGSYKAKASDGES